MYAQYFTEENMVESFPPMEDAIKAVKAFGRFAFNMGQKARNVHEEWKRLGVYDDLRNIAAEGLRNLADTIETEETPEYVESEGKWYEITPLEEETTVNVIQEVEAVKPTVLKITRRTLLEFAKEEKIPGYSRMGTYELKQIYDLFQERQSLGL